MASPPRSPKLNRRNSQRRKSDPQLRQNSAQKRRSNDVVRERVTLLSAESTTTVELRSTQENSIDGNLTEEMLTNDSSIERGALERRANANRPAKTDSAEEGSAEEDSETASLADNALTIEQRLVGIEFDDSVDNRSIDDERFIDLVQNYSEINEAEAKELAELARLVRQEQDYAVPNADWASIWKQQTPPPLFRDRVDNQAPIFGVIDGLLVTYKAQRDVNDYTGMGNTLQVLESGLSGWIRNKEKPRHEAAIKKLRNAARLQLHRVRLTRKYAIELQNPQVAQIARDPFGTYTALIQRRRAHQRTHPGDPNFPFPEMALTLGNMQNHIRDIQRRLLFGVEDAEQQDGGRVQVHANVSDRLKNELLTPKFGNRSVLDQLNEDIETLKSRGYPYRDTMELIVKFTKVIDYITFRGKSEPEINIVLEGTGKSTKAIRPGPGFKDDFGDPLKERRFLKFGKHPQVESAIPFYGHEVTAVGIYTSQYNSDPKLGDVTVSNTGLYRFEHLTSPDPQKNRVQWLIDHPEIILFPSYVPLDEKFFAQIRSVPIYMVGMINTEYLNADNIRQSPATFFEHDLFHIAGYSDSDSAKQQLGTLNERLGHWLEQGATQEDIYHFWSNNWRNLEQRIEEIGNDTLKDAIYKVLFMAVHEPTQVPGDVRLRQPAVMENDMLTDRIAATSESEWVKGFIDELRDRILRGEFGDVEPAVVAQLENAKQWLITNVPDIFETRPFNNFL